MEQFGSYRLCKLELLQVLMQNKKDGVQVCGDLLAKAFMYHEVQLCAYENVVHGMKQKINRCCQQT